MRPLDPHVGRHQRALEFLRGTNDPALRTDEDVGTAVDEIAHGRVGSREPWAVVLVAVVFQAGNHTRPVESRRAIEAALGVGEIERRLDLAVRNVRLGRHGVSSGPLLRSQCGHTVYREQRAEPARHHPVYHVAHRGPHGPLVPGMIIQDDARPGTRGGVAKGGGLLRFRLLPCALGVALRELTRQLA